MAGLDTLNVTKSGFFNINKKIVSDKTFNSKSITIYGEPVITDGVATSFSEDNYLAHYPLLFSKAEKISISFQGTFTPSDSKQCIWELINADGDFLTLTFENNRVMLTYDGRTVFSLGNLEFSDGMFISSILTVRNASYEFTLNYGKNVTQKTNTLGFTIPINSFSTINLGNSTLNRSAVWMGSINLKELNVYNNNTLLKSLWIDRKKSIQRKI